MPKGLGTGYAWRVVGCGFMLLLYVPFEGAFVLNIGLIVLLIMKYTIPVTSTTTSSRTL